MHSDIKGPSVGSYGFYEPIKSPHHTYQHHVHSGHSLPRTVRTSTVSAELEYSTRIRSSDEPETTDWPF